jgi:hypothetical protein
MDGIALVHGTANMLEETAAHFQYMKILLKPVTVVVL